MTSGAFATDAKNSASFYVAVYYLEQNAQMASAIGVFMNYKFSVRFSDKEVGDYSSYSGIIEWNPNLALRTTGGALESPAMVLGHEIAHAVGGQIRDKLTSISDPNYTNKEERRVIVNFENPAARQFGEGVRHDHSGSWVHVDSVTEH